MLRYLDDPDKDAESTSEEQAVEEQFETADESDQLLWLDDGHDQDISEFIEDDEAAEVDQPSESDQAVAVLQEKIKGLRASD